MEGDYTFDLHRILLGRLPWLYLAEILLRTTIVYFYALFVVRTISKRGMGQLAPFDFVIIIALGSSSLPSGRPWAIRCSTRTCPCCTLWWRSRASCSSPAA
jgi:hypothetical protein